MIKTSTHDGITTITFDRPEALNALTRELGEQALCAMPRPAVRKRSF